MTYQKQRDEAADKYFYQWRSPVSIHPLNPGLMEVDAHFKAGADWARRHFEMAATDDLVETIKVTQRSVIASMKDILKGFKEDIGGPGLTWEQLNYFLDEFAKKEPTIIQREHKA